LERNAKNPYPSDSKEAADWEARRSDEIEKQTPEQQWRSTGEMTGTDRSRSAGADLLKFIASILVVGIHVTPEYQGGPLDNDVAIGTLLAQSLVRLGLPVFFVASGYFLLNKPVPAYLAFYKSRIPKLVVPFFLYAALYVISNIVLGDTPKGEWAGKFAEILYAPTRISGHFWFIGSMLGIYLLTPMLNVLFRDLSGEALSKVCICLIGVSVFQTFAPTAFKDVAPVPPVSIPHIDTWLLYFVLGGFLERIDGRRHVTQAAAVFVLGYAMTVAFYYLRQNKLYDFYPHDGGVNMVLLATSAAYLLIAAGNAISSRLALGIIDFGSKYSFGVYLVHLLAMQYLGQEGFFDYMLSIGFYMVWLSILVTYVISLCITFLMDALIVGPVIRLLFDRHQPPEQPGLPR